MLFEGFDIVLTYREAACELRIQECHSLPANRCFEVIQGGIFIVMIWFDGSKWKWCLPDLHPVVKKDMDHFISDELIDLLISAIIKHYDCFTDRKILWKR